MRRYETLFILDPDLSQDSRDSILERVHGIISDYNGILISNDDWGPKRLAYEIRKKERGQYILLNYGGEGKLVSEIERFFRIDERVLKFITVLLEKDVDVDVLRAGLAEKEAGESQSDSDAEVDQPSEMDEGGEAEAESNGDSSLPDSDRSDNKAAAGEAETETEITE